MTDAETYRLYAEACYARNYQTVGLPEVARGVMEQLNHTYLREVCEFLGVPFDIENLPWGKDRQARCACFARYVLARRLLTDEERASLEGFLAFCTL